MNRIRIAMLILCGCLLPAAEFAVSQIFGDHMVLQRGQPIQVWGTASPGAEVAVVIAGQSAVAKSDATGAWVTTIPALAASGPHKLEVRCAGASRILSEVMIGDVWLASGQSNMVFALGATNAWADVRGKGTFPAIRVCKLPGTHAMSPTESFARDVPWAVLDSARANNFSAVAYYFATTVQPVVQVPIGVIQASCGGTMAEQWTPEAALRANDPQSRTFADRQKMQARLAADPSAKTGPMEAGAAALYNGTIHPLHRLKFAGVLWYQGEANTRSKDDYKPRLINLVRSWRELFGQAELPWIVVQLPGFGLPKDDGWMRLQEAQRLAAQELNLPLVVTIDQGSKETIHPSNKSEVGRRAGLAALQHVYRQQIDGSSPRPTSLRFEGGSAVVEFSAELSVQGEVIAGFELAGLGGAFAAATARAAGRVVTVRAPGVVEPTAIRYLWVHSPEAVTLFGPGGLPVGPFRFGGDAPQVTP